MRPFLKLSLLTMLVCPGVVARSPLSSVDPRRDSVKQAMVHSWNNYKEYGWGMDSMKSVSKTGYNWLWMNLTIVDSLDTLWVMGMEEEFNEAKAAIADFNFDPDVYDSLFDVTMRIIGGLLSSHSLTNDAFFLAKAEDLERRLLSAYNTPSGIPYNDINPKTSAIRAGNTNLAQAGTCLLELYYLSKHTGDSIFADTAANVVNAIVAMPHSIPALYPIYIDPVNGVPTSDTVSLDSCGDSFYEYLVKTWVLLGGPESTSEDAGKYRGMWDDSMDTALQLLVKSSTPSQYVYTTSMTSGVQDDVMGHLGCYAAGMFALGAVAYNDSTINGNHNSALYFKTGEELARTCHATYASTKTEIGPEQFHFVSGSDFEIKSPGYYLRPEVVEGYFYMYRYTHDQTYREWGWDAFVAINSTCYAPAGYSSIDNVDSRNPKLLDDQDPYFLAETLKYLYLLFSEDELLPLDQYVFTTESHPLAIFS
ncbi:mannosyl-oligosaccharide 1,2-alpha-mannosidase MNS1 [Pelomyxa schiedti]|nr:mannosyl-oligosaccharide 1,2-alpha-mannosidase MNS1 [Pelomyxa schiedti]